MVPFVVLFLSAGCIETSETDNLPSFLEQVTPLTSSPNIRAIIHKISNEAIYFAAGTTLGSMTLLSKLGWGLSLISPWGKSVENELSLFSHLCSDAAEHAISHMFKSTYNPESSWHHNHDLLSQISTFSAEEEKLLHFLENRWLAKSTGFFPSIVNWICPCFGIDVQVHPETKSSYARNPSNNLSSTYLRRMETWKEVLPHPKSYPLLLTRPSDLHDYLPNYLYVPQGERAETTIERSLLKMNSENSKVVIDLTAVLPNETEDPSEWAEKWAALQTTFFKVCTERALDPQKLICIHRLPQEEVGGIRLLPLHSSQELEQQEQFLLEWISHFGLTANRVELDRCPLPLKFSQRTTPTISIKSQTNDEFSAYLSGFEKKYSTSHPQKSLMVKGTLQALKELCTLVSENGWQEILTYPTRSSVVQVAFSEIKEQLEYLLKEEEKALFFTTASHLEQIHAALSSLLEVLSPYQAEDFPQIYKQLLTAIPEKLLPFTTCGIHSSAMTSVAGIFKAVEKIHGRPLCILYGENTYFECIITAKMVGKAVAIDEADDLDWQEVDLLLAQFNPALKRIDYQVAEYKVENIAETLQRALKNRNKPLTLALDCTLDFINSPRLTALLEEFSSEIENGLLNIICYRSGLKFDLFGMDNYCGAPFYMIHNHHPIWTSFNTLYTDPVLQTDRLSLNWFCLAYQSAGTELELYRKQVFENTRALLSKVPARLFTQDANYRIVPFKEDVDPSFIDIKVSGPFHRLRSAALVGGSLYLKCMEEGHPIFYRPSLGFYHPNFTMLFSEENTTIRLTLGLDPDQVDVLAACFEKIDSLNK